MLSWTIKKFEFQRADAFKLWWREDSWESLDCKEIKLVNPKENQPWILIRVSVVEAPIHWPFDAKSWLTGKRHYAEKVWGQEEKGTAEDEMVGLHHWPNEPEFEQTPGVGDGQGSWVCCSPWYPRELDMTEWLNWTSSPQMHQKYICMWNHSYRSPAGH